MVNGKVMKSVFHGIDGVIEYCKQYERCRGLDIPWHPIKNYLLQKWFKEQFDVCLHNKCQLVFPLSVNVVCQLVHLYKHIFENGIGLRQLMDYYFALRVVWHNDVMECKDLQSQGIRAKGLVCL